MSTRYVEQHICDICETPFDAAIRSWMTITAPNLDENQSFDFCTWDCLVVWVGSQGEEEEPEEEWVAEPDTEVVAVGAEQPPVQPIVSAPVEPVFRPAMSLSDAIASGALEESFRRARSGQ